MCPIVLNGEPNERVDSFEFLGTIVSSDMGFENNTDVVVKKAQQRLYFLRQITNFGRRKNILVEFYRFQSILAFSLCSAASASARGAGLTEW